MPIKIGYHVSSTLTITFTLILTLIVIQTQSPTKTLTRDLTLPQIFTPNLDLLSLIIYLNSVHLTNSISNPRYHSNPNFNPNYMEVHLII